jgi:hypothetical protein
VSAKGYRPTDDDRVTANTDILGDLPQRHAREDLIPIIARKSQNASNVDPIYFEYFQRVKTGRRCSCFEIETDPAGICPVCFGTGIVGGYNKRGTKTEVFDVTYPNVAAANATPDYNQPTRPVYWSLIKSAVFGTIDFEVGLKTNIGVLDLLDIKDYQPTGTSIAYYVRSPSEADFTTLTEDSLRVRLGQQKLFFRVEMKRVSPVAQLPKLVSIRIAYRLIVNTEIRVNIPRVRESLALEEFGIYQSFSGQTFWLDNTLKNVSAEDWMYNTLDGTRWKVTEVSDNKPHGILTSWDLTARLIHSQEGYYIVPLGKTVEKKLPEFVKSIQTDQEDQDFFLKSNANHLRRPGNRAETSRSDGPHVTPPGQTDVSEPKREV